MFAFSQDSATQLNRLLPGGNTRVFVQQAVGCFAFLSLTFQRSERVRHVQLSPSFVGFSTAGGDSAERKPGTRAFRFFIDVTRRKQARFWLDVSQDNTCERREDGTA